MRKSPRPGIGCRLCPSLHASAKDGLCAGCRMRSFHANDRRWTPEMDAALTTAYRTAKCRRDLSDALRALRQRWKVNENVMLHRSAKLGLKYLRLREWSAEDLAYLEEFAGNIPVARLAKHLRRSICSVKNKLHKLQITGEVLDGYSRHELAALFGTHDARIRGWIARGWLDLRDDRITTESVERFVWEHMQEFRFASCEEWWLKQMLKPTLHAKPAQRETRSEVAA